MIWKTSEKRMTQIQNTMEGHSRILEQTEDRISELEEEMEIKGKMEELLVKKLKICERNMQECTYSIKRPNLRITGIEGGEKVQAKGIHNIFNKIVTENFPNLEETMPIEVQEASRTSKRLDQNKNSPCILSLKQQAQRIQKEYLRL
jgi:chromosome segregation ATPase